MTATCNPKALVNQNAYWYMFPFQTEPTVLDTATCNPEALVNRIAYYTALFLVFLVFRVG